MRLIDADSLKAKFKDPVIMAFVKETIDNEPTVEIERELSDLMQYAADAQMDINRIVFKLNQILYGERREANDSTMCNLQ